MKKMFVFIGNHRIIAFFTLTTLLGYGPWAMSGEPVWFIYGMLISGLVLTLAFDGVSGVVSQLKSAVRFRAPVRDYLLVLCLLLSANLVSLLAAWLLFGDVPTLNMLRLEPHLLPVLFLMILNGGPIFEELFGLRGYALPRLLEKYSPLVSSLIVGTYFGSWHFVEFLRPGSSQYALGLSVMPVFILTEIGHSILMTWIFLRTKGNLWLSGIFFHWMMNNFAIVFQTDVTLSSINNVPVINTHYLFLYFIVISLYAAVVTVRAGLFRKPSAAYT